MDLFPATQYSDSVEISHSIAQTYNGYIIPAATGQTIQGPFGILLRQEIEFDIFIFRYYVLLIKKKSNFYIEVPCMLLLLNYMLENQITYILKGYSERIFFGEGQFQLLGLPADRYDMTLQPGIYRFCRLDIKKEYVLELSSKYKSIHTIVNKIGENLPALYNKDSHAISLKALLLLQNIFTINDPGLLGRMSIESNTKKLLLLSLDELETQYKTIPILRSDKHEHEKIQAFIKNNLDKKLTVGFLCQHFKVGKTKLQESFVQLCGKSVHNFIVEQRIEMAKLLLQTNTTVSEVASKVGYIETSNFIRVFKRATGLTPMQYKNDSGHFDY
jgi:AraC-like DNA-binding protein